jgi:hypothetical protein
MLKAIPGIRLYNVVAKHSATNLHKLHCGLWSDVDERFRNLRANDTKDAERNVAGFLDDRLNGFGPKQARNLLLRFGLAKHAVLLDSRVSQWLNSHGFPVHVSPAMLQDGTCYNFIEDGVREMCAAASIYPIVLDGLIFIAAETKPSPGARLPSEQQSRQSPPRQDSRTGYADTGARESASPCGRPTTDAQARKELKRKV